MLKSEGKPRISKGVKAKKVESSRGVMIKLIGNPVVEDINFS